MKKLLLIDGSNLMFRAYYATAYSGNLMKNSKGDYTNAVYGFVRMLNVILKEDFTHAMVAFDKGKATFRHKEYEEYKAKRKPMPEEFRAQLEDIKKAPRKLGFPVYETDALEADDIIASLAYQFYDDFDEIEILSNDRDLFQLLNSKVYMRLSKRGLEPDQRYTRKTLKEDLGLKPEQIPDLKGLMGDASDNLPGIPGVGEKTALRLLHEYGSIEKLLKNAGELKGKLKERIDNHGKDAIKWRDLATVKTDADLGFSLDDLRYDGYDEEALIDFYERLEFHSLISQLEKPSSTEKEEKRKEPHILRDEKEIKAALKDADALILETFGDNYHFAKKLGFALINNENEFFIPYDKAVGNDAFIAFLEDGSIKKSTFDLKKLSVCLSQDGVQPQGFDFDLLLAAYLLNPTNTKEDFKVIVSNFDYSDVDYHEEVYGKGAKAAVPDFNVYAEHATDKARAVKNLKNTMLDQIEKNGQQKLLEEIEMPLASILARMEIRGIRIDQEALDAFSDKIDAELKSVEAEIHDAAGETFNIGSPKQLGEILFEKLELPVIKKTKTGYSTNVDVLKKLKGEHPIIDHIMRYRTLSKLKSAYVNTLRDSIHDDGKIHTIYKQALTQTGRLSSIEPNLQTIPIRTEIGRDLRKVFIPAEGQKLLAADYSQIELRVLAHMAEEKTMIEAFKNGEDIHAITGKEVLGKENLSPDERRIAKAVNFGIIYGQSAWGLSEELDIPQREAQDFIERYYERFNGIKAFMDAVVERAKEKGYVETLFNRRRYIPELSSKIHAQREFGKRTAMNAPLQGSAADIIKIAMVDIEKRMRETELKSTMVLQIHDELVFNIAKGEEDRMDALVRKTMEQCVDMKVPLTVDIATGANLDEAK